MIAKNPTKLCAGVSLDDAVDFLAQDLFPKELGIRGISAEPIKGIIVVRVDADYRYDLTDELPREVISENVPYMEKFMGFPVVYCRAPLAGRAKGR
jgi:hypothetical protein